ncbi:hypothetical protein B0H12DRAFT_1078841 [Mycena haematopus]|nr:hypothetical protein B0H12DRAFT_1078841 [Mycena haematopus]
MHRFVAAIPLLLHLSLLFFFGGLIAFLAPVNTTVAGVAAVPLAVIVLLYGCMTVLPLVDFDCPYRTPLSNILWDVRRYFLRRLISYQMRHETKADGLHLLSMDQAMIKEATLRSDAREERDKRALAWTMKSLADDEELEPFVEGIPDMISGPDGRRRKYDNLIRGLLRDPQVLLGSRIQHLLLSCESGLLEPAVQARREMSCLKALWYLGMMGEKGKDRDPFKPSDLMDPPPPDPVQPLNFLQGLRSLPPKTPAMVQYLPSIVALANWNNMCSMYGHVKRITVSLQSGEAEGRLPEFRLELEEFLAERRRCKWAYLVPISHLNRDLEKLSQELKAHYDRNEPLTSQASSDWVHNVYQIISLTATSFNSVQYHVLLSFLQQCTDLDVPPYEFDLTVQTLQGGLLPVDIPVGIAVATFCDNVRKAVQMKSPSITHNDRVIGTVLPWVDKAHGLSMEMVERVSNSVMEYINNRNSNDAICRALRDSSITRVWERITGRLKTCRPDMLGDYSKAIWHLASLFPGLSTPDARLSNWPNFTLNTLSVAPAAPYSVSVIALLKTHILNAFDNGYQTQVLSSHLQALETHITTVEAQVKAKERPSLSGIMSELPRIEIDWDLITAVCSLLLQFPTAGTRPLQLLEPFPPYTMQTFHTASTWRQQALAAVRTATELLTRLDRRMEEARLAITSEFMQGCSAHTPELPYNAADTFDKLSTSLFVSRPAHPVNQRNFAFAFCTLAETPDITPDHSRILQAAINSPLFNEPVLPNDPVLPWLDDSTALSALQQAVHALQERQTFAFVDAGLTSRRLDDVGNRLASKQHLNPGRSDGRASDLNDVPLLVCVLRERARTPPLPTDTILRPSARDTLRSPAFTTYSHPQEDNRLGYLYGKSYYKGEQRARLKLNAQGSSSCIACCMNGCQYLAET